jgi:hypothetical protein
MSTSTTPLIYLESSCRYCTRYGTACGRTHSAETRSDWGRDWQGYQSTSHHVVRTLGTRVCTTRTFPTERAARREADAWAESGWDVDVRPGKAPIAPCKRRSCAVLSDHTHGEGVRQ